MWWCQGMWYLSRESQSIKLRQPTSKNPGLCTTRSQSCQDHQKPKSHNDNSQHLRNPSTQSQNLKIQNQNQSQSTQGFYCKKRQSILKSQQLAVQQAEQVEQLKGRQE